MKYLILLKILKLIYKLIPIKILKNKINNFYLEKANHFLFKLSDASKQNFSPIKIKKIFLTFGIEFKNKDNEFYYKLSNFITGNDNSEKNKIYLRDQIKSESCNSVTFNTWLGLRDIFYLRSKFVLGGICRKKSIKSAQKSKIGFFLSSKDKDRSRLDDALNMKDVKDYFNESSLNYNFDKKLFKKYMSSLHKIEYDNLNNNLKDNEKKFFNFLENKNVAIVGNALSENDDGLEIDSFDLVLRLNHINLNDKFDIRKKGSKTDITYVNGKIVDSLFDRNSAIANQVKAVVFKFNNLDKVKKFQELNPNLIIKATNNYNFFSFYSSFNLLPITLFDLLETNVKKIKIFHLDLHLSKKKLYYPYLITPTENEKKKLGLQSFVKHDPMSQHEFLKKLYAHPKITGDEKFDKIMKLNTYEYLEKLEDCYE